MNPLDVQDALACIAFGAAMALLFGTVIVAKLWKRREQEIRREEREKAHRARFSGDRVYSRRGLAPDRLHSPNSLKTFPTFRGARSPEAEA